MSVLRPNRYPFRMSLEASTCRSCLSHGSLPNGRDDGRMMVWSHLLRQNCKRSPSTRGYATAPRQRLDVQRLRADVDERGRLGLYTLTKRQGVLNMERDVANGIFKEFLTMRKILEPSSIVKQLATSVFCVILLFTS